MRSARDPARATLSLLLLALSAPSLGCQRVHIPPAAEQISAAILPLPPDLRAGAAVLGYSPSGKLVELRAGDGAMICLANDPKGTQFHVACYHKSLEPFMARGRELRAQGVKDPEVDSVRFREARSGKLVLPSGPASLYSLTGGTFDPASGKAAEAKPLYVVYIPYATSATTGLSDHPISDGPWLMLPGTPKAHIMFVPKM
jgi:hypothetical protein